MACQAHLATSMGIPEMNALDERLGRSISRHRKALGWTQAQLAERVSIQAETLSRIENGRKAPSLPLVGRLAKALELELHELLRLQNLDNPRGRAIERLLWFGSRLSPEEIELVMDVGALVLSHARREHQQ